jgi:hypothetical protein
MIPQTRNARGTFNPNSDIYNADTFTAINDCLIRMRNLARFTVFMDLDEILAVMDSNTVTSLNISEFLSNLAVEHPNAGSFVNKCTIFTSNYSHH